MLPIVGMELQQQKQRAGWLIAVGVLSPKVLEVGADSLHRFSKQQFMETLRFTG